MDDMKLGGALALDDVPQIGAVAAHGAHYSQTQAGGNTIFDIVVTIVVLNHPGS